MFHLFLLFCCCSHLYHKYIPTKRICQYQITRKIKKNKEKLQFYIVFTCFSYVSLFFIIIFLAQNPNFPLACMLSAAGMVLSSSSVIKFQLQFKNQNSPDELRHFFNLSGERSGMSPAPCVCYSNISLIGRSSEPIPSRRSTRTLMLIMEPGSIRGPSFVIRIFDPPK